jgi:tetratricopeptide (TPR) repeat protein
MLKKLHFKKVSVLVPLLLCAVSLLIYGININGGFVYDDPTYLVYNNVITSISPFDFTILFNTATNLWGEVLPFRDFLYVLQYKAFGSWTTGYHMVSLLLFVCTYIVLFKLIKILVINHIPHEKMQAKRNHISWLITLLISSVFLFHPIYVESFNYISGQKDALSMLFILLSIYFVYKSGRKKTQIILYFVLGIFVHYIAVLSKISALSSILFIPILLLITSNQTIKKKILLIIFWLIGNIPVVIWFFHISAIAQSKINFPVGIPLLERIPRAINYIGHQIAHVIKPFPLNLGYPVGLNWTFDIYFILGILLIAVFSFFLLVKRNRLVLLGCSIFILYLSTTLHIYPDMPNDKVYDRYMAVPFVGLLISIIPVVSFFLTNNKRRERITTGIFIALISLLGFLTSLHVPVFHSVKNAFGHTYRYFPNKKKAVINLANYYFSIKEHDKAFEILEKQYQLTGSDINLRAFKGRYFFLQNKYGDAIAEYEKIIYTSVCSMDAKMKLAQSYDRTGNSLKAIKFYSETIKSKEIDVFGYKETAKKRIKELQALSSPQLEYLRKKVQNNPADVKAYAKLAGALEENYMYEDAISAYEKIIAINGSYWAIYYNLATLYSKVEKFDKAVENYNKSISLNNQYPDTYNNLGLILKEMQDYEGAIEATKTAMNLDPKFKDAALNLAILYYETGNKTNALKYFNYTLTNFPEMEDEVNFYKNKLK